MLCCLGLVAGSAAGAALGGARVFLAPIAGFGPGFGVGLIGDLTMIRCGLHGIRKNAEQWVNKRERELRHEEPKEV